MKLPKNLNPTLHGIALTGSEELHKLALEVLQTIPKKEKVEPKQLGTLLYLVSQEYSIDYFVEMYNNITETEATLIADTIGDIAENSNTAYQEVYSYEPSAKDSIDFLEEKSKVIKVDFKTKTII